jgi:hypothetical protein
MESPHALDERWLVWHATLAPVAFDYGFTIELFDVGATAAQGLMYRTADGKVEEFLFFRN